MEKLAKATKPKPKTERIPVAKELTEKIDRHIAQVVKAKPGTELTKKDYVEYLLEALPEVLPPTDVKKITDRFFDEEKFLKFLMTKVKTAKRSGEDFDITHYLNQTKTGKGRAKKKKVTPSKDQALAPTPGESKDNGISPENSSENSLETRFTGSTPFGK